MDSSFSFRAKLLIELLTITELATKASECLVKVYVSNVKQKSGSYPIRKGKVDFNNQPERLIFGGDARPNEIVTGEDFVRIQVLSTDNFWKREIGACEVRLNEALGRVEDHQCATEWFRLRTIDGKETGKILVRITVSGNDVSHEGKLDPNHKIESVIPPNGQFSDRSSGLGVGDVTSLFKASSHGTPLHSMVDPRWTLRLRIHACRDLKVADTLVGTSDPFCEIHVRNEVRFTEVVFRDLNPVFANQVFEFGDDLDILNENDDVTVLVYDHDRLKSADFLGCFKAPIWAISSSSMRPSWHELVSKKMMDNANSGFHQTEKRSCGKILISAEFGTIRDTQDEMSIRATSRRNSVEEIQWPLKTASRRNSVVGIEPSIQDTLAMTESLEGGSPSRRNSVMDVEPLVPVPSQSQLPVPVQAPDRTMKSLEVYKPYKGKVWLYRLEVTVLQVRGIVLTDTGNGNVLAQPVDTSASSSRSKRSVGSQRSTRFLFTKPSTDFSSPLNTSTSSQRSRRSGELSQIGTSRTQRRLFCEMRCGGSIHTRFRTKPCRDSFSPSWRGETFVAGLEGGMRVENGSFGVALMNRNVAGQEFVIGTVVLDLARICKEMGYIDVEGMALTNWFELLDANTLSSTVGSLQMRIVLKPVGQTRVSSRDSLALRLDHCTNININGFHSNKHTEVFARVRLENNKRELLEVKETSMATVHRNGEVHFDQVIVLEQFWAETMRISIQLYDFHSGEKIGWTAGQNACDFVESQHEEWKVVLTESYNIPEPPTMKVAGEAQPFPVMQVSYRRAQVQNRRFLPILGTLSLRLHSLHLPTHDFKHDVRVTLRYGPTQQHMCTRIYRRDVNLVFDQEDSKFEFLVRNPHDELEIEVRDMYGLSNRVANEFPIAGKFIAKFTVTCFDVIEAQFSQGSPEPRLTLPIHLSSRTDPGCLHVSLSYNETVSALLSRNANPLQVQVPPFSIERSSKEMRRFARVMGWPWILRRTIMEILNWNSPTVSFGCMVLLVLFCTNPSWSERPLIIFPVVVLIYLAINYRKRMDGRFIANFIVHSEVRGRGGGGNSGTSSDGGKGKHRHASLKISVIKARNVPSTVSLGLYSAPAEDRHQQPRTRPSGGLHNLRHLSHKSSNVSDASTGSASTSAASSAGAEGPRPVFVVKMTNLATLEETLLGYSLGLERPTHNPDWSFRPASSFKPARGSTLVNWRAALSSLMESQQASNSVDVRFNLKNNQAFLCAVQKQQDDTILIVTVHRIIWESDDEPEAGDDYQLTIGPRDAPDVKRKRTKEVSSDDMVFEEKIYVQVEPDDILEIEFGRSSGFFDVAIAEIENPFRQPQNTLLRIPLTSANWLLGGGGVVDGEDGFRKFTKGSMQSIESVLHSDSVNSIQPQHILAQVEVEFQHFYDLSQQQHHAFLTKPDDTSKSAMAASVQAGATAIGSSDPAASSPPVVPTNLATPLTNVASIATGAIGGNSFLPGGADNLDYDDDFLLSYGDTDDWMNPPGEDPSRLPRAIREKEVSIPKKDFEQASRASIQSWKRQPDVITIDFHDRSVKGQFLGRATLPLFDLVTDMDSLEQPTFSGWLSLGPRFDGTEKDRVLAQTMMNYPQHQQPMVFVSAQIILPFPEDEDSVKEQQEARKAKFPHEKFAALARQADRVYRDARAFNDRMERIKNTFNWAVMSRTRLVLRLTLALLILFAFVPSRFIVLFTGLFLFTEKFRPHGIVLIALNHLFALAPTDEDFSKVVSREIFGHVRHSKKSSRSNRTANGNGGENGGDGSDDQDSLSETDEEDDDDDMEDGFIEGKLSKADAAFKKAIRAIPKLTQKLNPLRSPSSTTTTAIALNTSGGKPNLETMKKQEQFQSMLDRRLGSIAQGYLRVLERHMRGVWFRRYFFTYDGVTMQYWAKRKDFLNRSPSIGRITSIKGSSIVLPNTREARIANENDALKLDCLFLLELSVPSTAMVSGVGSTFGNLFRHDMLGGRTMFAASSIACRDLWINALQRKLGDFGTVEVDEEVM